MLVLVTGATGLVGEAICKKLIENSIKVKALVRPNSNTRALKNSCPTIEFVDGDINDIFSIENAIKEVDFVIHAAGLVSFAPKDKEKLEKVNVEGTENIVNTCLYTQVKKIIFISSIAALGRPSSVPEDTLTAEIDENQKWEDSDLNSNYAVSKYKAECEVWRGVAEGLPAVVFNPTIILGEGDWNKSSTQLFKYVWDENKFSTSGFLNYVDVEDVAEAVYLSLMSDIQNERFLLNSGTISFNDFFDKVAKVLNKKAPSIVLKPWMISILWRIEAIRSFFTGSTPLITKETAKTSKNKYVYPNTKVKNQLGLEFKTLDETLARVAAFLVNKYNK